MRFESFFVASIAWLATAPLSAQEEHAEMESTAWTDAGVIASTGTAVLVQQNTGNRNAPFWGVELAVSWFLHPNVGVQVRYRFGTTADGVDGSGSRVELHVPSIELALRANVHPHLNVFASAGPALAG